MRISRKLGLAAAAVAALTSSSACAEVLSLRCTVTPESGKAPYNGYVWIDMPNRRAFEQWYPAGAKTPPRMDGPFGVSVLPNEVAISSSANANGMARFRLDRQSGIGTASDGRIICVGSDVNPPPLPPAAKPR